MKSYARIGRFSEVKATAREFLENHDNSVYLPHVYDVLGDAYLSEGYYGSALESYLNASRVSDGSWNVNFDDKIIQVSSSYLGLEKLNALLAIELDGSSRAILSLAIANRLMADGEEDEAALVLFKIDRSFLPSPYHNLYDRLKGDTYVSRGKSKTIGVILSGGPAIEKVASSFVAGIHEATREIQRRDGYSIETEVITTEDGLSGIRAAELLSRNENVLAIIGPAEDSAALAVAAAGKDDATALLFPTSSLNGLASVGESVYQMNSDLSSQGRYAARYAVEQLAAKTIAVMAPSDQLGRGLTDGFLMQADELGAEIVSVEWYSGIPVDLSPQLSALRSAAFRLEERKPKQIQGEILLDTVDNTFQLSTSDFFEEERVGIEEEEVDSSEIILSSIDAIYLPIHAGDINYVASQFSSYGMETRLLGNANWYEPDELNQEMIGPNLEGMTILTDYLHPQEAPLSDKAWQVAGNYESREEILMALTGYDIAMFLAQHLRSADSRSAVRINLDKANLSRGVSRHFAIASDHPGLNSSIHVLNYSKKRFTLVGEFVGDSLVTSLSEIP
ncbi:MAG: ABC transporter substrate-binding protein [Candidatus Neomarinimicrobiota bacterium]|nr:ABC transporter substrate-binding protein [Candidatus Neomarinimicrobiota bacterium]